MCTSNLPGYLTPLRHGHIASPTESRYGKHGLCILCDSCTHRDSLSVYWNCSATLMIEEIFKDLPKCDSVLTFMGLHTYRKVGDQGYSMECAKRVAFLYIWIGTYNRVRHLMAVPTSSQLREIAIATCKAFLRTDPQRHGRIINSFCRAYPNRRKSKKLQALNSSWNPSRTYSLGWRSE